MFVRKKRNASGSISIQILEKRAGINKLVKTVGSSKDEEEINVLYKEALNLIPTLSKQPTLDLFCEHTEDENIFDTFIKNLSSANIICIGPELILAKIYDSIGFSAITDDELLRHLVIARLISPGSKLKVIEYLKRYRNIDLDPMKIYRFMDKFHSNYKDSIEQVAFFHTKKVLGGIAAVFYDVTTLYFETEDEDDLRKIGFSKDGKSQSPQIMLGLLVGEHGYPIGYDVYEGNSYEGNTFIPILQQFEKKFSLQKPVVIADSGLLSKANIEQLKTHGYSYILGARIKSESIVTKQKILSLQLDANRSIASIKKGSDTLVLTYTDKRAKKDEYNRIKGLKRLEKRIRSGKLNKASINNRGYNKYLQLKNEIQVEIDYEKFHADALWDGLKGYITNTNLSPSTVVEHYSNLWHIEKAFRISKTDLKIRPVYHYLKHRIQAHISISFIAYTIYKELERLLSMHDKNISVIKALEEIKTIYGVEYVNPLTQKKRFEVLQMSEVQSKIENIIQTELG
jgi:transposase